jgi:hypothetical protein
MRSFRRKRRNFLTLPVAQEHIDARANQNTQQRIFAPPLQHSYQSNRY